MKSLQTIAFFGACLLPAGVAAQDTSTMELVFEEAATVGPPRPNAQGEGMVIPITGGHVEGPEIKGTIQPGGSNSQSRRADGCDDMRANYSVRTDDGAVIKVVNTGVMCVGNDGTIPLVRTQPVFEAPPGKYAWLNDGSFVGTFELLLGEQGPSVKVRIYRQK